MRKSVFFGSVVTLVAMAVAATTVFACTNFVGTFTVTGSGTGTQTAVGTDTCTNYSMPSTCTFGMAQTLSGSTSASGSGGTFTIAWSVPHSISSAIAGTYDVRFVDGDAYNGNVTPWQIDCMDAHNAPGSTLGQATLTDHTSGGTLSAGTGPWSVPTGSAANSTSPDQESAVCISDSKANFGNEAPIEIT